MRMSEKRHFQATAESSGYSFLTVLQNEASDTIVSKFIFTPSLVAKSNNLSYTFMIKFKWSFNLRNGFDFFFF